MLSYWEQQSFIAYDHIVIGSGILGLSAAIELKQRFTGQRVLVLERGLLPTGASTRNAGFACMGSVTELLSDLKFMPKEEVVALFAWRKKGLELLRRRLGEKSIGYCEKGSYELVTKDQLHALDSIPYLNDLLKEHTTTPPFSISTKQAEDFGFNRSLVEAIIENNCEGELDSGMMMRALTDYAISVGVEIKTGADVSDIRETERDVTVTVPDHFRNNSICFTAQTVTLCTNAFTPQLLPNVDVVPGRGQVLVTSPIPNLPFQGIFHFDEGYYYFREINGRVLIGGGRNMDFQKETTTELSLNDSIQANLEQHLRNLIIPDRSFEVSTRWSGIMAFGATKFPIVRAFSSRIFGAFRMGGMGVALGSEAARMVVDLVAKQWA